MDEQLSVDELFDTEYNVTVHRDKENVVCSIYWNLKKYFDLIENVVYSCPLYLTNPICVPHWLIGFKKCKNILYVSLKCGIVYAEVSFTLIVDANQSPFIITAGNEKVPGIYSSLFPRSATEKHARLLSVANFVVMCRVVFGERELTNPTLPNHYCSCDKLRKDLDVLFSNQQFSDVKLINGETEFHAHKCFLGARSRNFGKVLRLQYYAKKNAFNLEYDEGMTDVAMREGLRYIYTGTTMPLNAELAIALYHFAAVLELEKLQEKCVNFLTSNLSIQEFLRIYNFALGVKSKLLMEKAESFFIANKRQILNICYPENGETMVKPPWMKDKEYLITDQNLRILRKIYMTTDLF